MKWLLLNEPQTTRYFYGGNFLYHTPNGTLHPQKIDVKIINNSRDPTKLHPTFPEIKPEIHHGNSEFRGNKRY
jgi:hypothetical protein